MALARPVAPPASLPELLKRCGELEDTLPLLSRLATEAKGIVTCTGMTCAIAPRPWG